MGLRDHLKNKAEAKLGVDLDGDGKVGGGEAPPQAPAQDGNNGGGLSGKLTAAMGLGALAHGQSGGSDGDGDGLMGKITDGLQAVGLGAVAHHVFSKDSDSESDDDHHGALLMLGAGASAVGGLAFFHHMRKKRKHNYIIIVDASTSMSSGVDNPPGATRWSEAQEAVSYVAPSVCKGDQDGVSLYIFNNSFRHFGHVKTAQEVEAHFRAFGPAGGTFLGPVLDAATQEHHQSYAATKTPTHVLIVHDGEPLDKPAVRTSLINASQVEKGKKELSFSFIQVGNDAGATAFLHELDSGLAGCRHDIVDTMKNDQLQGQSFSSAVAKVC